MNQPAPDPNLQNNNKDIIAAAKKLKKEEGRRRAIEIARQRKAAAQQSNEVEAAKRSTSTRHGARNQRRHQKFTKWLLDTFDLKKDSFVLDVAGGKGELAARLAYCHHVNVCIIDPREANVSKCFEDVVLRGLPKKWQQIFQQNLTDNKEFLAEEMDKRVHQIVSCLHDGILSSKPYTSAGNGSTVDKRDVLSYEMFKAAQDCSLIIGMHADNATEAIVDVAMALKKPFVVVPCCVFPNLFCNRVLSDGTKVRSHEQFCRYLAEKDDRFSVETLPFDGRNVAIWWRPPND